MAADSKARAGSSIRLSSGVHGRRQWQVPAVHGGRFGCLARPRKWCAISAVRVLHGLRGRQDDVGGPRPANKRVWLSVEHTTQQVIDDAFANALRRDPEQRRRWGGASWRPTRSAAAGPARRGQDPYRGRRRGRDLGRMPSAGAAQQAQQRRGAQESAPDGSQPHTWSRTRASCAMIKRLCTSCDFDEY